ncbi:hypothetical protein BSL78_02105 [Apostichopus japonicus]|uniref:DUF7799 domain-containing protein n=1 Tax=Stichopus japonicus TaxID=307972 RepID=A0A2G8LKZ8_STIJA|nr:hypothetical protein BSL78_02105 [Apostichopus japonicus]
MKPKLTEVGKTLEEAERYQQEHEEMVRKIAAKQPEIAALLSQADFNISTQQFYNDVYEAMAHSLGEAWRDLNRLLEKRKQLLDDAVNFHKNIKDVTEQMDSAAAQFKDPRIPSTPAEVDKLLQEHEDLNQDLLSKSIAVVTEGQSLLEKIKELGENAPKEETQVTLAACGGIQKAVEELMQRRKMLEDLLSQKRKRLNQFATVAELDQELNKGCSDSNMKCKMFSLSRSLIGLRGKENYLQRKDIGSDPGATEALMKEHDQVENAAKKVRESVDRVLSESEQLEHSDPQPQRN